MALVGGDLNQSLDHKAGDDATTRSRTSALQKLVEGADAGEVMKELHRGVEVFTYKQSKDRQTNRSWIDYIIVSKSILAYNNLVHSSMLFSSRDDTVLLIFDNVLLTFATILLTFATILLTFDTGTALLTFDTVLRAFDTFHTCI